MSYNQPPPPPGGSDGPPPPPAGGYGGPPAGGVPGGVPRPGELLNRFLARLIDHVILGVVYGIIYVVLSGIFLGGFTNSFGELFLFWTISAILQAAIYLGYFALMESNTGQTVGKMALGIRVWDLREGGGSIGYGRAAIRYFGRIVSSLASASEQPPARWSSSSR